VLFIAAYVLVQQRRFESKYRHLPLHRRLVKGKTIEKEHVSQHIHELDVKDGNGRMVLEAYYEQRRRDLITQDALYLIFDITVTAMLNNRLNYEAEKQDHCDNGTAWALLVQQVDDASFNVVEKLLDQHEGHIFELAKGQDINGRHFIDIASARIQNELYMRLYLNRRFEIAVGPAEYKSMSSLVLFAKDHGEESCYSEPVPVAMKFMKQEQQYLAELQVRNKAQFDSNFVVAALAYFDPSHEKFRASAIAKGYQDYPYCVIMTWADTTVERAIDQRHIAGEDWDSIRIILKTLCNCLIHIHSKGIVHGDIKPNNLVIIDGTVRLIDMDACCRFGSRVDDDDDYAGRNYSSGYLPPEMFVNGGMEVRCYDVDTNGNRIGVTYNKSSSGGIIAVHEDGYELVRASPAQDMWAVGVVLYLLCTGFMLFPTSVAGDVDDFGAYAISSWSKQSCEEKVARVNDKYARHLLSLLLNEDPARRIDASHILTHPFLTGRIPHRLEGEAAEYDVFISYRVASDVHLAEMLYTALQRLELRVWWDKKCLLPGQPWEEGFCAGLASSCCFVCLSSKGAIFNPSNPRCNFANLTEESKCDNVLLEWRLALELKARNMIEGVFPLLIGDAEVREDDKTYYSDYNKSGCHPKPLPNISVRSVETKLRSHLDSLSLGLPYETAETVAETVNAIIGHQGAFIRGELNESMAKACAAVFKMRKSIKERNEKHIQVAYAHPISSDGSSNSERLVLYSTTSDAVDKPVLSNATILPRQRSLSGKSGKRILKPLQVYGNPYGNQVVPIDHEAAGSF
jgi:serine/threonine protein kinase